MLAGLISNPSGYDPKANPDDALARRNLVLQNMADQGYITQGEYQQYSQEHLPTASDIKTPAEDSAAPYFTSWLRQQLVDKYGAGEAFGGGLQVTSTLDLNLQDQVQQIAYATRQCRPELGRGGAEQRHRRRRGDGRRLRLPDTAVQPGHPGPTAARVGVQAVHPGDGARAGALARPGLRLGPAADPVQGQGRKKGGGDKIVPEIFPVHNYGDEYLGSASIATATTYSDNSVYSQLGTQVGPANVAQTANQMGVQTDLSTPDVQYSVNGGPFEPYNPALILGGLRTGVTPLEMAHAYQTLQHNGQIVSGTMADSSNGPVAIEKVQDSDDNLVETNDGDPGENKVETKQEISPEIAATARGILHTVVTSGTGRSAYTGDPSEWGKTGTTENNGDAWFVGATKDVTVAVWVGHADSVQPMETEYAGGPVDGGTIPALIFNQVINAVEQLKADEKTGRTPSTSGTEAPALTPAAPAPSSSQPAQPSQSQGSQSQGQQPQGQQPQAPSQAPPSTGGGGAGGGTSGGTGSGGVAG